MKSAFPPPSLEAEWLTPQTGQGKMSERDSGSEASEASGCRTAPLTPELHEYW